MIRKNRWYGLTVVINYTARSGYEFPVTLPGKREVCHECNGTGTVLCDSLRGVAFSSDEMADDPDFAESYFGGEYDERCNICGGENVVTVVDWSRLSKWQKLLYEAWATAQAEHARIEAQERSMRARGIEW